MCSCGVKRTTYVYCHWSQNYTALQFKRDYYIFVLHVTLFKNHNRKGEVAWYNFLSNLFSVADGIIGHFAFMQIHFCKL